MSREKNVFEKFPKKWPKGVFARRVCQYAERDSIGLITPLLLGYSAVTCLPAVHKRDDLKLFACFLISPRLMGGVSFGGTGTHPQAGPPGGVFYCFRAVI